MYSRSLSKKVAEPEFEPWSDPKVYALSLQQTASQRKKVIVL